MKRLLCIFIILLCVSMGTLYIMKSAHDEDTWVGMVMQSALGKTIAPIITVPAQKLPVPNGYDGFIQASKALVDTPSLDACTKGMPDLSAQRKLVSKNVKALALLHRSLNYPFRYPRGLPLEEIFRQANSAQRLMRLLVMELDVNWEYIKVDSRADTEDYQKTFESIWANISFGSKLQYAPYAFEPIGVTDQIIGYKYFALYIIHSDLGPAEPAEDERMLCQLWWKNIINRQMTCADRVQEQLWFSVSPLQTDIDKLPPSMAKNSEQYGLNRYERFMQYAIKNAQRPYPDQEHLRLLPGVNSADTLDMLQKLRFDYAEIQTQQRLILVEMALRVYRAEHGSYPTRLDALVPADLPQLPADPFSRAGTFHYARSGDKYLLYSIGPDGRDDGGKAIVDPRTNSYYVKADSTGDIVAGVNW